MIFFSAQKNFKKKNLNPPPLFSLHSQSILSITKELLLLNANPLARNNQGKSIFMTAIESSSPNITIPIGELLTKFGADVNAQDLIGDTPIIKAVKAGQVNITNWLIFIGANPTIRNKLGKMPIHIAEEMGMDDMIEKVFNLANGCLFVPCDTLVSNCVDTDDGDGHYCECKTGFSGENSRNGTLCTDINECELLAIDGEDPCSRNTNQTASCHNTPGSYSCKCIEGYTGTGETCIDINECALELPDLPNFPCGDTNSMCQNNAGSYDCPCKFGFMGDGLFADNCVDIDECSSGDPCDPQASCLNTFGSFECTCHNGFMGNGLVCEDIDECTKQPCVPDVAVCENTIGSFSCNCTEGYVGDGRLKNWSEEGKTFLNEPNVAKTTLPTIEESSI